jgi:DNA phosphorothioation-associated putative methyltransferase
VPVPQRTGLLDDAAPLFREGASVPCVGVLLALPCAIHGFHLIKQALKTCGIVTVKKASEVAASLPSVGKRVGGAFYVHRDALSLVGDRTSRVGEAERVAGAMEWNVAKIEKSSVSFLLYESFDVDFPALLISVKVDFGTGTVSRIDYRGRENPPILHRKEVLLPPDDPHLPKFRALTISAEEHGLFRDSNKIGTREAWLARVADAGLVLRGGRLVSKNEEHFEVARHKTAIVRRDLSQPMQLMMRFGS